MRAFFDSSAIVKRYIKEKGTEDVQRVLKESETLMVSSLCLPETISALCRRRREKIINQRQYETCKEMVLKDFDEIVVCGLSAEVITETSLLLERFVLRTVDAIHIASAILTDTQLFVTGDVRQRQAAEQSGLKVLAL